MSQDGAHMKHEVNLDSRCFVLFCFVLLASLSAQVFSKLLSVSLVDFTLLILISIPYARWNTNKATWFHNVLTNTGKKKPKKSFQLTLTFRVSHSRNSEEQIHVMWCLEAHGLAAHCDSAGSHY